jgi:murein DD-endopeptidase MepM/ murein hydrolase activator NlpD
VVTIRRLGAEGLEVDVRHPGPDGGFMTRYAHLGMVVPALAEGKRDLAAGAPIGRVGRTGVTYGTHVHFELHLKGSPVDPEPYFTVARCR